MTSPVLKRLFMGFGASVYGQAVVIVIQLVSVPVLLNAWGTELYGEWLILFAIPSYLSLTELGFSQSAANDMCARVERKDRAGALAVFQSLFALVSGTAFISIMIITVVLWILPIGHWLHFGVLNASQVRWILWLLMAEVLIRLADGISDAGFRSGGDLGIHGFLYMTTMLAQYLGIWIIALVGYGPVSAAVVYVVVRCIAAVFIAILLLKRHPWLRYALTHARMSELRRLARPALANISQPLAQALNIQGMILVVGAVLGPLAVVVFSTLRTLTRFATKGAHSVLYAMEPEIAFAWGAQDKTLLRKLYQYSIGYSFWIAMCGTIVLYFMGDWILEFWTHGKVDMNTRLYGWLLLSSVVGAFWYSGFVLQKAANRHLRAAVWYAAASFASLAMAAVLMRITGRLADAGLVLLFADMFMAANIAKSTGRLMGISFRRALLAILDLRGLARPLLGIVGRAR